jgi:hypothetical protein
MKLKGSHIFYLLTFALVLSVYYFDYYRGEEEQKQKEQASILIPFLKDEVIRVEGKNASGEYEMVKSPDGWMIKRPFQDLAGSDEVNGWLQSLTTEKSLEKLGEGENVDWAIYGLDQSQAWISLEKQGGEKIRLDISARKNFEGNPFIKKNDEKVVYVGNAAWLSLFDRSSSDLRDKRVFRSTLADLESIEAKRGSTVIKLSLREGKWIDHQHESWVLDQNATRELVNTVSEMRALEFRVESAPSASQLKEFGLNPPVLQLTYGFKAGKSWVADLGKDKSGSWFIWPKELNRVAKIDESFVQTWLKADPSSLRDRELPFSFAKEQVQKMIVESDKNLELLKDGDNWKASSTGTVETTEVNQLLDRMRQLRVVEFMDGKPTAPGLQPGRQRFILKDQAGKSILELIVGDSFKKRRDKEEESLVYVKSSIYPEPLVLREEDVKSLAVDKIIKVEPKSGEQNANSGEDNGAKTAQEMIKK